MPAVTIRNIPAETHRALKQQAILHGRSTEAEVRAILEAAVRPLERIRLGTALAELGRKYGPLEFVRDPAPAEPADFE